MDGLAIAVHSEKLPTKNSKCSPGTLPLQDSQQHETPPMGWEAAFITYQYSVQEKEEDH